MISLTTAAQDLLEAYRYVVELARTGANVTHLVNELNKAIAGSGQAASIIANATALLPAARQTVLINLALDLAALAAVAATAAVFYLKRREILGALWLKARARHKVRPGPGAKKSFLLDGEVLAVITALGVALLAFIAAQTLAVTRIEAFSAIGPLGPEGKIGGYPSAVAPGQKIKQYLYVYNHMGVPTWYVAKIYLANQTPSPPLAGQPLKTYQKVLNHNQSWIEPLQLAINRTGSYWIVGELWLYSPDNLTLVYTGNYVQLKINATRR